MSALALGVPALALLNQHPCHIESIEDLDPGEFNGNHLFQFLLLDHQQTNGLEKVKKRLGDGEARKFVAIRMLMEPFPRIDMADVEILFGPDCELLQNSRRTALFCNSKINKSPFS